MLIIKGMHDNNIVGKFVNRLEGSQYTMTEDKDGNKVWFVPMIKDGELVEGAVSVDSNGFILYEQDIQEVYYNYFD